MKMLTATFLTIALCAPAVAQDTSVLIDTPFSGPSWRLAISEDGETIAMSSADETISLWTPSIGIEHTKFALPQRPTLPYRARGIAIQAGTDLIAFAQPPVSRQDTDALGGRIYINDPLDGGIVQTIATDLPTRPQALAFSPSGIHLAATLSEGCGLRVWDTATWTLSTADDSIAKCSGDADTTEVRFLSDTTLFTSGEAGVARYDFDGFRFLRSAFIPANEFLQSPDGLAISPDGTQIVVGDRRVHDPTAPVELKLLRLDSTTLQPAGAPLSLTDADYFLPAPDTPIGSQVKLNRVVWEDLGDRRSRIVAGGVLVCNDILDFDAIIGPMAQDIPSNCLVRFDLSDDATNITFIPIGDEAVIDLAAVPTRDAIAVLTRNSMTLYDTDAEVLLNDWGDPIEVTSPFADLRSGQDTTGKLLAFDVSDDGSQVYFEDFRTNERILVDTQALTVSATNNPGDGLRQPDIDANFFGPTQNWFGAKTATFASPDLLTENDLIRAVTMFADEKRALVGTADSIQIIDLLTGDILCRQRVTSEAFRVNVAKTNSLAIIGHANGTIRWYGITFEGETCTFDERLALNIRDAADEPGVWTWHAWIKNTGQFATDVLAKQDMKWRQTGPHGDVVLTAFQDVAQLYDKKAIRNALTSPPKSKIPRDEILAEQSGAANAMRIRVTSPSRKKRVLLTPKVKLSLRIDGDGPWPQTLDVLVGRGISVAKETKTDTVAAGVPMTIERPGSLQVEIDIPATVRTKRGEFDMCFAINGTAQKPCQKLSWAGEKLPKPKPNLHAVLVGFSQYDNPRLGTLNFAQNDALDLARLLASDVTRGEINPALQVFESVSIDLVVSQSNDIAQTELDALAALPFVTVHPANISSIAKITKLLSDLDKAEGLADDIVLFSYSGHGTSVPTEFGRSTLLLGPNTPKGIGAAEAEGTALRVDHVLSGLANISAEQLIFIDACRSFSQVVSEMTIDPAFENVLISARANPAHVIFSAQEGQFSPEGDAFVFSDHRPEGMNGNGVFTYAILDALTNLQADTIRDTKSIDRIEIDEIRSHLRSFFTGPAVDYFDRVKADRPKFIPPEPVWLRPDRFETALTEGTILRTLKQ